MGNSLVSCFLTHSVRAIDHSTCMVVARSACTASVFSLYLGRGLYVRVRSVRESAETDRELDDLPSVAG